MAAFATENSNLVWQKVKIALMDADPAVQAAFAELKKYLAQQRGNVNLQFIPITAAQYAAAGGTVMATGTATLYAWFNKKTAVATQNTVKLYDDATDDTTAANAAAAEDLRVASGQCAQIYATGKAIATGIVATAHTTLLGTTDGSAANSANGFVIVGA